MADKTIDIYSTPQCGFCKMLKSYLDEKNISYNDINVLADNDKAREMVALSGQSGVPVSIFNKGQADQEIVVGFNKPRIDQILGL